MSKGDFNRFSFDRRRHMAGVLQQQGRVMLDSDWNEWIELITRRIELQARDTIGPAGSPKGSDGFDFDVKTGVITMRPGRVYVNGVLAEIDATDPAHQLDWPVPPRNVWQNLFGNAPWPGFDLPPQDVNAQILVYLEVWKRHITGWIEDARLSTVPPGLNSPDWDARPWVGDRIREAALGGPDTTTRLQTVAQLKTFALQPGALDCAHAVQLFLDQPFAQTTGLLQVDLMPTTTRTSPCDEPVDGGYLGTENRLYRVEVASSGNLAQATFKWSRENGAFTVALAAPRHAAFSTLTVNDDVYLTSIGFDTSTQLGPDDWVELCGEETELGVFANPLVQIDGVPQRQLDDTWLVRIKKNPAPLLPLVVPTGAFLRRWSGDVISFAASGTKVALDVPAETSGISVHLVDTGKDWYRAGDYWAFAARVDTRDVEPAGIAQRPQRVHGIDRAFAALGIWNKGSWVKCGVDFCDLEDACAEHGDPCCAIDVPEGGDIEAAIAKLPPQGGTVCLAAGQWTIEKTISVRRDFVRITGCGGVRTHLTGTTALFDVMGRGVAIERIAMTTAAGPAVIALLCNDFKLRDCRITITGADNTGSAALVGGADIEVWQNDIVAHRFAGGGLGVASGTQRITIRRNHIGGGQGSGISLGIPISLDGETLVPDLRPPQPVSQIEISDNLIVGMAEGGIEMPVAGGIVQGGPLVDAEIVRNRITRCLTNRMTRAQRKRARANQRKLEAQVKGVSLRMHERACIAVAEGTAIRIADNVITDCAPSQTGLGILCGYVAGITIEGNFIERVGSAHAGVPESCGIEIVASLPVPIIITPPMHLTTDVIALARVARNVVTMGHGPALLVRALSHVEVDGNELRSLSANDNCGAVVRILDAGTDRFGEVAPAGSIKFDTSYEVAAEGKQRLRFPGPVRFADNVVLLGTQAQSMLTAQLPDFGNRFGTQFGFETAARVTAAAAPRGTVLIAAADDVRFSGNEVTAMTADPSENRYSALVTGATVRVCDNRLAEYASPWFSILARGRDTLAAGNDADHCIFLESWRNSDQAANVISVGTPAFCERLGAILSDSGSGLYTAVQNMLASCADTARVKIFLSVLGYLRERGAASLGIPMPQIGMMQATIREMYLRESFIAGSAPNGMTVSFFVHDMLRNGLAGYTVLLSHPDFRQPLTPVTDSEGWTAVFIDSANVKDPTQLVTVELMDPNKGSVSIPGSAFEFKPGTVRLVDFAVTPPPPPPG